ncbi:Hypothetical_protein [Hexamita inflata]|uniref:Hypothetical_protein n=1 Tax=Hexamita inflata TaxID=28002 RepID=A0AA86NJT9_9EUKA|nr:Hypothetical protein HINF_LOCUS8755 [Hexamita inflata]
MMYSAQVRQQLDEMINQLDERMAIVKEYADKYNPIQNYVILNINNEHNPIGQCSVKDFLTKVQNQITNYRYMFNQHRLRETTPDSMTYDEGHKAVDFTGFMLQFFMCQIREYWRAIELQKNKK